MVVVRWVLTNLPTRLQADEDAQRVANGLDGGEAGASFAVRGTPAFMVSLIFHTSLLLLLALLTLTSSGGSVRSFDFTAATSTIDQQPQAASLLLPSGDAPSAGGHSRCRPRAACGEFRQRIGRVVRTAERP
ncbi:MAG: hypothetical protein R3C56_09485 [Pirellulaceae bacterium]